MSMGTRAWLISGALHAGLIGWLIISGLPPRPLELPPVMTAALISSPPDAPAAPMVLPPSTPVMAETPPAPSDPSPPQTAPTAEPPPAPAITPQTRTAASETPRPTAPTDAPRPITEPPKTPTARPQPDTRAIDEARARAEQETARRREQLAETLRAETEALAAQAAATVQARQQAALVAQFQQAIARRVKSYWRRPNRAVGDLQVQMRITLLPGGEVGSVLIVRPSGDDAFDASAEAAVQQASPLPVPDDAGLFNSTFRVLNFTFKPEEI